MAFWRRSTAMSRPPSARPRATEPNEASKPSSISSPVTCSLIHPFEIATSHFPDYLIVQGTVPLLVIEGKKPDSDVLGAFREARLYANELNAIHPSGLNPATRVIASDGKRLFAGWYDQATPILDIPFDAIDPYGSSLFQMGELASTSPAMR